MTEKHLIVEFCMMSLTSDVEAIEKKTSKTKKGYGH
jgi:hypothetical protein